MIGQKKVGAMSKQGSFLLTFVPSTPPHSWPVASASPPGAPAGPSSAATAGPG